MKHSKEDFTQLRRLLALKRHENPPPGYFDRLHGEIMAQLQEDSRSTSETWMSKLFAAFQTRPGLGWGLAGACSLALLLLFGDTSTTPSLDPARSVGNSSWSPAHGASASMVSTATNVNGTFLAQPESTNLLPLNSLFDRFEGLQAEPVHYSTERR